MKSVFAGGGRPSGALALHVVRAVPQLLFPEKRTAWDLLRHILPWVGQSPAVFAWRVRNFPSALRGWWRFALARALHLPHLESALYVRVKRADGSLVDYGLASLRVVTTAGVGFITDAFQNLVELELMKYHGIGTGTTAEAVGDTALVTELTTQYNPDNTRATGSQTESAANVYRTVGTNAVDSAVAITEHGIFSQAATGGGVLLDRSVFSAINLGIGDSLQSTYDFTCTAGG